MKLGNWVPMSKGFAYALPSNRPFTDLEAMYSMQMDADNQKPFTVLGAANRWQWSRGKVGRFVKKMGAEIRRTPGEHPTVHKADTKRTLGGHPRFIKNSYLADQANTKRTPGDTQGGHQVIHKADTTINKEPKSFNPNPKETPMSEPAGSDASEPDEQFKPTIKPCPHKKIVKAYNNICGRAGLPETREWSGTGRTWLTSRWREKEERQTVEWWSALFTDHIITSKFLMGEVKQFQVPGLQWIVKKANLEKILNGWYVNRGAQTGCARTDQNIQASLDFINDKD